jgi:AraC-like DNA-binding protein
MRRDDASRTRMIYARAGVGMTAGIVQREALYFSQLTFDQPAFIVVRHGIKILADIEREWVVRAGEAVVVAGGRRFDVTNSPDTKGLYEAGWLTFEPRLLATFTTASPPMASSARALGRIEVGFTEAFTRACDAIQDPHSIPDEIAQHRIQEVLLWLDRRGVSLVGSPTNSLAQRVRTALLSALDRTWTAGMLVRDLHMSEATLRRHLAAEGTSLTDLLADARMSHALKILQSTDHPVGHIARDVGYESASRFAVRFRKRFGFPPTAIRGHRRESQVPLTLAEPP